MPLNDIKDFRNNHNAKLCYKMYVFLMLTIRTIVKWLNDEIHKHTPSSYFLTMLNPMLNFTVSFLWSVSHLTNSWRQGESLDIYRKQKPKWTIVLEPLMIPLKTGIFGTYRSRGGNQHLKSSMSRTHTKKKWKLNRATFSFAFHCCFLLLFLLGCLKVVYQER